MSLNPSKVRKCSEIVSGPINHELGEELLDEVVDDYDPELIESTSPNVLSAAIKCQCI